MIDARLRVRSTFAGTCTEVGGRGEHVQHVGHGYQKLELQIDRRTVEVSVRGLYIEFSEPVAPNLEAFHRPREQHRAPGRPQTL